MVPTGALFSTLAPAIGVFTYVFKGNGYPRLPIIGQVSHPVGVNFAHLAFIAPGAAIKSKGVTELLDFIAEQMGNRGALNLLADVQEKSPAFEVLRYAGYAIYARQRVWMVETQGKTDGQNPWRPAYEEDEPAIRALYSVLVPAIVQQAEPPPWERLHGYVFRQGHDVLAYVSIQTGSRGSWVQPFIHPNLEHIGQHLPRLFQLISERRAKPMYLGIRTHQAWLESALAEMGARAGPRQAVMVKRLAITQKAYRPLVLPQTGLENIQPKASTTLTPERNLNH